MASSVSDKVLARIRAKGKGSVFTPKDFIDLASHETIRQILSRLERQGTMRRLLRGIYEFAEYNTLLNRPSPPNPDAIAQAIARAHGWTILPSGETATNMLGLSTQLPAKWEYFSDGPSKKYLWEGGEITFKHRTNKETSGLSHTTALLVQALKSLGQEHVDEKTLEVIQRCIDRKQCTLALKEARYATSWVYEIIRKLASTGGTF